MGSADNKNKENKFQKACCDFSSEASQEMFEKMKNFCGGGKGSFDCGDMMQKMQSMFANAPQQKPKE